MLNREVLKYELAKLEISDDGEILTDVLESYFDDIDELVDRALELIVEKILELESTSEKK